jgi:hypothetical protein
MKTQDIQNFNKLQQELYLNRTGIFVDIQNIGKNTQQISVREESKLTEIQPGVFLKTSVMDIPDGSFSNMYDFYWNPKNTDVVPEIHSSNKSYSVHSLMEEDINKIATINGSFFFLTDVAESTPIDLMYNLCIREGKVFGLPSENQPIAYIEKGTLHVAEPKAQGTLCIDNNTVAWIGALNTDTQRSSKTAVLYNSKCSTILYVRDSLSNVRIGILDSTRITTPKRKNIYDLVIKLNKKGQLIVSTIQEGGGTHFFAGNFILQFTGKNTLYNVGDIITDITLDGIKLETMTSAISIGKRIDDSFFLDEQRTNMRDARSVIAQDLKGNIHFIVFDGSKYIPGFTGVSAKMISAYFSKKQYSWAYFLDGGGSSRLIVREKEALHVLANQFAFRKFKDEHVWDWKFARKVASSISLSLSPHIQKTKKEI